MRRKFAIPGGWGDNLQRSIRGGAWTDASGVLSLAEGGHSIRSDMRERTDQYSSDDHLSFRLVIDDIERYPPYSPATASNPTTPAARASVMESIGGATVAVEYDRLAVNGREGGTFGESIPYGERWSPGDMAETRKGDVTQFDQVMALVAETKPDRLVNLAYFIGELPPRIALKLDILGMGNCFEAARLGGVAHTVYASSLAVSGQQSHFGERAAHEDDHRYGDNQYAMHKIFNEWQAEDYSTKYGMAITGIRPANVTGPDKIYGSIDHVRCVTFPARGEPVSFPHADAMRAPIHVDDVASVVHFDPPDDHKTYLHRSGRTARAGRGGLVVSLLQPEQMGDSRRMQRRLGLAEPITLPDAGDLPAQPGAASGRPADPPAHNGRESSGHAARNGESARNGREPNAHAARSGQGARGGQGARSGQRRRRGQQSSRRSRAAGARRR